MRAVTIPIRSLMPEPTDAVEYMPMPREMSTFEMPRLPEPGPDTDLAGARDVLAAFIGHLDDWLADAGSAQPPALDLAGLPATTLRVLNETLGEGEVSALVDAGHEIRVQETVFAGVWREQHLRGTHLLHDYLLAAPIPPVVGAQAGAQARQRLRAPPLPAGAMNVPALLHELQEAMDRSGPATPAHVVNLTLLPLSPEDSAHLDAVLDGGSVVVLSRGFGNCRISSTAARNVWRVQYFNNMQTLILNTIEVVPMPEVALAAQEDLVETRARLADLVQWMGDSISTA
jgi:hydrogenase-1 operon protein HyaF